MATAEGPSAKRPGTKGRKSDEPMVVASFNGTVHTVSDVFAKISNYTADNLTNNGGLETLFENQATYSEIVEYTSSGKNWEGHAIILDASQDEYIARVKAFPIVNGGDEICIGLGFFDLARSKKNEHIETRLLKAISQCTELLFSQSNPDKALSGVLDTIGKSMLSDRCYLMALVEENGELFAERRYEWVRKSTLNNAAFKSFKKFNYKNFSYIIDRLTAGNEVSFTPRSKAPAEILNGMVELGIYSFLKIPIIKNHALWGYLGFEDTENMRDWSRAEKKALKSLAHNIGAFFKINSLTDELMSKNQQLEKAIESATDGLWVFDLQNDNRYISPRMYEIFGYKNGDWPFKLTDIRETLKTEDTEMLEATLKAAVAEKQPQCEFETVAKHKSGRYIWLKGIASFNYDAKGTLVKHSGSISDISTEKTFELKIKRQEEHYQRLVNSLKEVVFEADKSGKITFLNNSWKNLTGKNTRDSLGKSLSGYICKEFVPVFNDVLEQLRQKQSWPGKLELQVNGKGNTPHWVEIWLRGMYDSNYEMTGISGSIFDIHSKKAATEQLRESEELYRLISENTKDLICLHDAEGRFQYISPSMHEMLGYPVRALTGQSTWECIHPEDVSLVKQTFNNIKAGKKVGFIRYRARHRKGHYIWVETIANLQQNQNENPQELLIQTETRDISQQKKAEEEIKNALEKERQLVELRTNLINMISHEFRTPLTTIKSSSDLLLKYLPTLKKSDTKDRFGMHFGRISAQVNRINELISGVLLLGRLDTGKIQFLPESVNFRQFINDFLEEYYKSHPEDERRVDLVFEGQERETEIDPLLVSHILRNLVSNALKYSQGKKNPELYIKFEKKLINVTVQDYGIGIEDNDLKNLFQSFFRGSNALTIPGTGLGLVIVKHFVDMHGGTIYIDSKVNEGTIIQVTLPI